MCHTSALQSATSTIPSPDPSSDFCQSTMTSKRSSVTPRTPHFLFTVHTTAPLTYDSVPDHLKGQPLSGLKRETMTTYINDFLAASIIRWQLLEKDNLGDHVHHIQVVLLQLLVNTPLNKAGKCDFHTSLDHRSI